MTGGAERTLRKRTEPRKARTDQMEPHTPEETPQSSVRCHEELCHKGGDTASVSDGRVLRWVTSCSRDGDVGESNEHAVSDQGGVHPVALLER